MTVRSGQSWVIVLALFGALAGCGRSGPLADPPRPCVFDRECEAGLQCVNGQCVVVEDAGARPGWKQFGEPCEASAECASGYCVDGPRGAFCSAACDGSCPSGFSCKVVPDPSQDAEGGTVALCALPQPLLCQPCDDDLDCGASGGDHCLTSGIHGFCGQDCTFEGCPDGYTCADSERGRQCVPLGQTCDCTPDTEGRMRGCATENEAGTCYGSQTCSVSGGWGACSAREAMVEDCNGIDDDCDGQVDEDLPLRTCSRSGPAGVCPGAETCQGAAGWRCDAPTPATESCNYVDDDCDGTIDQGFVDGAGRYVQSAHCGGCGNDCAVLIPESTATRCDLDSAGAPTCIATACAAGFFPSPDGRQCLRLADSLCRACTEDSDCAGPGSRCVSLNGEQFCGRDCGPGSAFPSCPGGFTCSATAAGQQCVPSNGTCQCTAQQLGTTRSCNVQTCTGYQTCANTPAGPAWSACDVASFNPELCDGVDNDCDGQVDEGFRNAATGKYATTGHCGFCNNDCSKYWSPTLQHTTGVCDTALAVPVCKMGACTTELVGGTTFEWRDVNGETGDGCECRRVQGNTTLDDPEELAPWVDENCDGVDGVIGDALFVWAGANPGGNGAITAPFRTIGAALASFPTSGKRYVLVAEGTYPENLSVADGMRLYGGYARDFKRRDPLLHTSTIQGVLPTGNSGPRAAVHIRNAGRGAARTVISGFTLRGVDRVEAPADDQDGAASVTVLIEDSGANARLVNNDILAGRGGQGGRGTSGTQGFGRQSSSQLNGKNGLNGSKQPGPCPTSLSRAGGLGGVNPSCPGASAHPGGSVGCPSFDWNATPIRGAQVQYPPNNGRDGEGGFDWSYDHSSGFSCSHVTESGFPSNIQTHDGRDGQAGSDGSAGTGGAGAPTPARYGSIVNGRWVTSPFVATGGLGGAAGEGGGGGGAGGGTAWFAAGGCPDFEIGATGGGGGAGGCGGTGGLAGRAGGASIGVLVVFTTSPGAQVPVLGDNRIQRNFGGDGGSGGFGGAGGLGGAGGFGGINTNWSGSTAGQGGEGGNGGSGGGGGGGAGGPSFGILAYGGSASAWSTGNVFVTASGSLTGGKGGTGGSASGTGTGSNGPDGASSNFTALTPCSAGCPALSVCDLNGVCIPQ